MWTRLTVSDVALVERWVAVMQPMNRNYSTLKVAEVRGWMATSLGETWYYRSQRGEIALRFEFIAKRERYQLYNVGFLGALEPAEALDLTIERCMAFVQEHEIDSIFALRPKNMDHPGIEAFHRLVPFHPRVAATLRHDSPRLMMWDLAPPEAHAQAASPELELVATAS